MQFKCEVDALNYQRELNGIVVVTSHFTIIVCANNKAWYCC